MELLQTNSFYITKKIIKRVKRQPAKWAKICVNYITGKGLMCKIYRDANNSERINNLTKKMAKDVNKNFS